MRATPDAVRFPTWPQDAVAAFCPLFTGSLLLNGGYDRDSAEAVVSSGAAHAVSFGASFIGNPGTKTPSRCARVQRTLTSWWSKVCEREDGNRPGEVRSAEYLTS